jgi:hypothetical protein
MKYLAFLKMSFRYRILKRVRQVGMLGLLLLQQHLDVKRNEVPGNRQKA